MSEELKPCPFCGGLPQIEGKGHIWRGVKGYSDPQYFQLTHFCKGIIPDDDFVTGSFQMRGRTEEQLITAWNTRAAPKVKPLEWRNSYGVLRAETAFGDYIVTGKILRIGPMSCEMVSDDPKAAAQADYERRILSALTQETKT